MGSEDERTLNLGLHIVDGVRGLHLKGDSLAREGLHEDLHVGLEGEVSKVRQDGARRRKRRATVFKRRLDSRGSAR